MELLTIVKAKYLNEYKIEAVFSNGIKKILDFRDIINNGKGIIKKLQDKDYFMNFTLDPFTIDWNNEIGFDPQDLYEHGKTTGYDDSILEKEPAIVAEPQK